MRYWHIYGFDYGPHWDAAIVVAENEDEAREQLAYWFEQLTEDEWLPLWGERRITHEDRNSWSISEVEAPVLFVLGGGCR